MSNLISLEDIRIAKPCRADWSRMTGDERARFCGSCHKNVYDLSQMTREDASHLIAQHEGNLCVRLYRRPDGTVITSDCPVGKRETMRPMWWTVAGFVALMASGAAVWSRPAAPEICPAPATNSTPLVERARQWPLIGAVVNRVSPQPVMVMGAMVPTTVAPTAPTPQPTNAPLMGKPTMGAPLPPDASH